MSEELEGVSMGVWYDAELFLSFKRRLRLESYLASVLEYALASVSSTLG
jgi:hypothetical protein